MTLLPAVERAALKAADRIEAEAIKLELTPARYYPGKISRIIVEEITAALSTTIAPVGAEQAAREIAEAIYEACHEASPGPGQGGRLQVDELTAIIQRHLPQVSHDWVPTEAVHKDGCACYVPERCDCGALPAAPKK